MDKNLQEKSMYVEVKIEANEDGTIDDFDYTIVEVLDNGPKLFAIEVDDFIYVMGIYNGYPIAVYIDSDNGKYYAIQGRIDMIRE